MSALCELKNWKRSESEATIRSANRSIVRSNENNVVCVWRTGPMGP